MQINEDKSTQLTGGAERDEICLANILEVENDPALLDIVCPNAEVPLWSLIRSVFFQLVMSDMLYDSPIVSLEGKNGILSGSTSQRKVAWRIGKAFLHNATFKLRRRRRLPITVFASGARVVKSGDMHFNCLADHFLRIAPNDSLLIEEMFNWNWPFPRAHQNVLLHTPLRVLGAVSGKLNGARYHKSSEELVDLLCQRAKLVLGYELSSEQRRWLVSSCARAAGSLERRIADYTSILRASGTLLLLKEEACYGGPDNVSAIVAAKRLGVVTAEYQHGAVSAGHPAYNFGLAVSTDVRFRAVLPEHFLSFGEWWSSQINAPVKKIVIGNPHRSTITRAIHKSTRVEPDRPPSALILGDGIDTEAYLELGSRLAAQLGHGFRVVFRPHPLERAAVNAKFSSRELGSLELDSNQDIYSSFQECSCVISEISTGLFEAVGLVQSVFIWDTLKSRFSFPTHPFFKFRTVEQLASAIRSGYGSVSERENSTIWADNWEEHYSSFLRSVPGMSVNSTVDLLESA